MRAKLATALLIVYVVWGSTYLAIAVADRSLPPLLMLSSRFALAGALLYGWSWWRGDVAAARLGRREWTAAAVVGGLLLFVDTGGVAWAEQRVASGLTALLVACVPLFTALLDRTVFGVRLSLGAIGGIAAGLLGVALLVGPSAHVDPVGAAVILVSAFAWACGSAYGRVAPLPSAPFLSAGMQMLWAGAMLAVAGAASGEVARVHPEAISAASALAFAFLVVFGSIVAFTAYGWLLRSGASSVLVSTYAYVNPAVAVLLGWALAGERVDGRMLAAGAVILASVAMLVFGRRPSRAATGRPKLEHDESEAAFARPRGSDPRRGGSRRWGGARAVWLGSGPELAVARFPGFDLSFRYPAAWKRVNWCWTGTFVSPVTVVTTAQPAPSCASSTAFVNGTPFPPPEQLAKNGIAVAWLYAVRPGFKAATNGQVGGRPAVVRLAWQQVKSQATGASCGKAGTRQRHLLAQVPHVLTRSGVMEVDATICGPDYAAGEATVRRLLASATFGG